MISVIPFFYVNFYFRWTDAGLFCFRKPDIMESQSKRRSVMNDYSFGNFLRELRERRGLSQYQLGSLVGVSNKAVSKWENGSSKPKSRLLFRLSEVLCVSVDELLTCRNRPAEIERKGIFAMKHKKELWENVRTTLFERYGEHPPLPFLSRLESEAAELEHTDHIVWYALIAALIQKVRAAGHFVHLRDGTNSLLTAFLLGATEINPLPPHYYCPFCKRTELVPDAADGWDLPPKTCLCGKEYSRDGHAIPLASHRSLFHREPAILLGTESGYYDTVMQHLCDLLADVPYLILERPPVDENDRTARYLVILPPELAAQAGTVLPFEKNRLKYLPYYPHIHVWHSETMERYHALEQATGTSFDRVPFLDGDVLPQFTAGNTEGVGAFGFVFLQMLLKKTPPQNHHELIRFLGLVNCSSTLFADERIVLPEFPSSRDDIYNLISTRLLRHGIDDPGFAYRVMENTRKGVYTKQGMDDADRQYLTEIGVTEEMIGWFKTIKFLTNKSISVLDLKYSLILMWYKLRFPEEFGQIYLKPPHIRSYP
ncbi:MAG: helix-turn-helix domain-containing protein [Ruminococcaceae bacterium]|nr:helix-turn-helix domain-containing protein [Oscillospiraceae bacterium]